MDGSVSFMNNDLGYGKECTLLGDIDIDYSVVQLIIKCMRILLDLTNVLCKMISI